MLLIWISLATWSQVQSFTLNDGKTMIIFLGWGKHSGAKNNICMWSATARQRSNFES